MFRQAPGSGYAADGEALDLLNGVRARAGLSALTAAEAPNQPAFREAIMQEVINASFQRLEEGDGLYSMQPHQTLQAIPGDELNRYNNRDIMSQNPGY